MVKKSSHFSSSLFLDSDIVFFDCFISVNQGSSSSNSFEMDFIRFQNLTGKVYIEDDNLRTSQPPPSLPQYQKYVSGNSPSVTSCGADHSVKNDGNSQGMDVSQKTATGINKKLKDPCDGTCRLKCSAKISDSQRKEIFNKFWNLQRHQRWKFVVA